MLHGFQVDGVPCSNKTLETPRKGATAIDFSQPNTILCAEVKSLTKITKKSAGCFFWANKELHVAAMFRHLLTAYMLLLTATGANPCCCSLSRLVGMVRTASGGADCLDAATPVCCGGGLAIRSSRNQSSPDQVGSASEDQHAPNHSCACVSKACKSLPPERSAVIVDYARSWLDCICLDWAASQTLLTADADAWALFAVVAPPPPSTGRETRIALCSWRC